MVVRVLLSLGAALLALAAAPSRAQQSPAASPAALPGPLKVERFTLPNGLRVALHEDHRTPEVAVSVSYHAGSADDPEALPGLAHLVEHLLFQTLPGRGDPFTELQSLKAKEINASTWFDRLNVFETVPTTALEPALRLEAARMSGWPAALTQEILTKIVSEATREAEADKSGGWEARSLAVLYGANTPYGRATIGEPAVLSRAELNYVRGWVRRYIAPNNAVLVLSGDIQPAAARAMIEQLFGGLKTAVPKTDPLIQLRASGGTETFTAATVTDVQYLIWPGPSRKSADFIPMNAAMEVIGGLRTSRLDLALATETGPASKVTGSLLGLEHGGQAEVTVTPRWASEMGAVTARARAIVADFVRGGPRPDELKAVSAKQLESYNKILSKNGDFGGKAYMIAEDILLTDDPDFTRKQVAAYAALTPAVVKAAAERWLNRPVFAATVRSATGSAQTAAAPASIPAPAPPVVAAAATPARPVVGQGPRIALVVGNATYGANFGTLANAINDANLIAGSLRRAGFEVIQVNNADQRALRRAIQTFGTRLAASGRGTTGLFYYAGHGVQARGANYLVPVNSALESEADLEIEAVPAEAIMRQMEQSGIATSIVVLDACRNLPLARGTREGTRGLARMDAPNGSFVAYSTAPGSVATDGSGSNSPFAAALASEMARPGQQIEATFKNVRRAVMQATGGKQTPWDSSSLIDSFVFVP